MKYPDKGLRLAQRFHDAMQGLPYLAGIIPACLDDEGKEWLRSKPVGLMPALHGLDHEGPNGARSEFRGLDAAGCQARIAAARGILAECGIETEHLILPFNAWEPELASCHDEGICYVWGGGTHNTTAPSRWPISPPPYPLGSLTFVPSWLKTYAATLWQMGADDRPLNTVFPDLLDLPGKAVITLHITWEAAKSEGDFRGVKWLVDLIGDRVISPEEYLSR